MSYYKAGDYYRRRGDMTSALATLKDITGSTSRALARLPGLGIPAALATKAAELATGKKIPLIPEEQEAGATRHYRRMNPLNPRALRRALRRAKGFERFARRVMHLTHRRPGQVRFKFGRKRRSK